MGKLPRKKCPRKGIVATVQGFPVVTTGRCEGRKVEVETLDGDRAALLARGKLKTLSKQAGARTTAGMYLLTPRAPTPSYETSNVSYDPRTGRTTVASSDLSLPRGMPQFFDGLSDEGRMDRATRDAYRQMERERFESDDDDRREPFVLPRYAPSRRSFAKMVARGSGRRVASGGRSRVAVMAGVKELKLDRGGYVRKGQAVYPGSYRGVSNRGERLYIDTETGYEVRAKSRAEAIQLLRSAQSRRSFR